MTKKQFETLKVGDTVIINGQSRSNAGKRCKVTYICDDRMWIKPIDGVLLSPSGWCLPDWNEICYTAANIIRKDRDSA